jgi:hypothetical protein
MVQVLCHAATNATILCRQRKTVAAPRRHAGYFTSAIAEVEAAVWMTFHTAREMPPLFAETYARFIGNIDESQVQVSTISRKASIFHAGDRFLRNAAGGANQ